MQPIALSSRTVFLLRSLWKCFNRMKQQNFFVAKLPKTAGSQRRCSFSQNFLSLLTVYFLTCHTLSASAASLAGSVDPASPFPLRTFSPRAARETFPPLPPAAILQEPRLLTANEGQLTENTPSTLVSTFGERIFGKDDPLQPAFKAQLTRQLSVDPDAGFFMRGAAVKRTLGNYNVYLVNKSHQDVKLINSNRMKRNNGTVSTFADSASFSTQPPVAAAPVIGVPQFFAYDIPFYPFDVNYPFANVAVPYPYY